MTGQFTATCLNPSPSAPWRIRLDYERDGVVVDTETFIHSGDDFHPKMEAAITAIKARQTL